VKSIQDKFIRASKGIMQRLSFGNKRGANYSNYVNADFTTQALVGFHAGALIDFRWAKPEREK
jgi:hypothetical protein